MYETILVPYDGSREAKKGGEHAVELAAALGAKLTGIYVIKEGGNPWSSQTWENQQGEAQDYAENVLSELGDMAGEADVPFEMEVKIGPSIHEQITDGAKENGVDLIVMGSGYHGKYGSLLGSTAEKVLRTAETPVTTIRIGDVE